VCGAGSTVFVANRDIAIERFRETERADEILSGSSRHIGSLKIWRSQFISRGIHETVENVRAAKDFTGRDC